MKEELKGVELLITDTVSKFSFMDLTEAEVMNLINLYSVGNDIDQEQFNKIKNDIDNYYKNVTKKKIMNKDYSYIEEYLVLKNNLLDNIANVNKLVMFLQNIDTDFFEIAVNMVNNCDELRKILQSIIDGAKNKKIDISDLNLTSEAQALIDIYIDMNDINLEKDIYESINIDDDVIINELRVYDGMALYINDLKKYSLLSEKEQNELFIEYSASHSKQTRQKLINSNLRLVIAISKRYINKGLSLQDLVEEGNIGLIKAIEKFDPTKGYKFSTYSAWWIQQSIKRAIMSQSRVVKLPSGLLEKIIKYKKVRELNSHMSIEELAEYLNTSIENIISYENLLTRPLSLNELLDDDENELLDIIPTKEDSPLTKTVNHDMMNQIYKGLEQLTTKEKVVIILGFGLYDNVERPLGEVAKVLGCTREAVRLTQGRAIKKLKKYVRQDNIGDTKQDAYSISNSKKTIKLKSNLVEYFPNMDFKEIDYLLQHILEDEYLLLQKCYGETLKEELNKNVDELIVIKIGCQVMPKLEKMMYVYRFAKLKREEKEKNIIYKKKRKIKLYE